MVPLLIGLGLVIAGFAGLWRLQVRRRRSRRTATRGAPGALGVYLAEGLAWVLALVVLCVGAATVLTAWAALHG
ncbi:MAG TPA: hypothetical protein VFR91_05275 [Dyella sp.]|nr:hypothetical protein [Dyella sp.]